MKTTKRYLVCVKNIRSVDMMVTAYNSNEAIEKTKKILENYPKEKENQFYEHNSIKFGVIKLE